MREFAAALPRLRRAVKKDLGREGMPRERALACAVRLLDLGFFRIGGEEYAETNESYGVATILREHVSVSDGEVVFDFPAKSGQRRVQSIRDPEVQRAIEAMRRRRSGPEDLLVFREGGSWRDVRSEDVNAYLREKAGDGFSAKDFRTWHGTVLAAVELAARGAAEIPGRGRASDPGGGQARRRAPRQHARRLPQLLHRPEAARPLPRRRDDPASPCVRREKGRREAKGPNRARGSRPDRVRPLPVSTGRSRSVCAATGSGSSAA